MTLDLHTRLLRAAEQRQATYEIGTLDYERWGEHVECERQCIIRRELNMGPPHSIISEEDTP